MDWTFTIDDGPHSCPERREQSNSDYQVFVKLAELRHPSEREHMA